MTIIGAKLGRINIIKSRAYLNSRKLVVMCMLMILWIVIAVKIVQWNSAEIGFDLFSWNFIQLNMRISVVSIFYKLNCTIMIVYISHSISTDEFILTHFGMFAQMLLQEMKQSVMKTQSQLLEYIALSLYFSANLSSKLFMLQDGDQISTLETFQHFIILDLLWLRCSSIVKGRMGVEVDGILDKYRINGSALQEGTFVKHLNMHKLRDVMKRQ